MQERYTVVMPDGARFGPADLNTLREWATAGRIGPGTTLIFEATGATVLAGSVAGLFSGDGAVSPVAPPQARNSRTTLYLVLGVLGLAGGCVVLILAAILFPVFASAKSAATKSATVSNVKQLSLGMILYASDADEHFPPDMTSAEAMRPAIAQYLPKEDVFKTLNPNGGEFLGDARLSGRSLDDLVSANMTIMLRESRAWPDGDVCVGKADGSAKRMPFAQIAALMRPDPFGKNPAADTKPSAGGKRP